MDVLARKRYIILTPERLAMIHYSFMVPLWFFWGVSGSNRDRIDGTNQVPHRRARTIVEGHAETDLHP